MNKLAKVSIGCFLLCEVLFLQGCSDPQFKPTYFRQGNVVQEDTFKNAYQKKQILRILTHYHHWWKEDPEGNILISRSLAHDLDLLFSYTNKSMDSVWISNHLDSEF